ncbi:MAG: tyrosine-type recombinase/integrase [Flavobacteriaceae bacterium]|nr:tyrosine-type recombinase/integrase [Flavobacteriaceae bacterium]
MTLQFPKVHTDSLNKVFVSFYIGGKRYRLYNGNRINSTTDPNSYPHDQRLSIAKVLAAEIYSYLLNGGVLLSYRSTNVVIGKLSDIDYIKQALDSKLAGDYSSKYKAMLQFSFDCLEQEFGPSKLSVRGLKNILSRYCSGVSYNTLKRHLNVLINEAVSLGLESNPMTEIKSKKSKAVLHKPFDDIATVLEDIKGFNKHLHLCCLLTYGCLLRPHREVRELTWGDFSYDLSYIKLSGFRNKSGRNRIVPIPGFIKPYLNPKGLDDNIFTGEQNTRNPDYFKTLWSRYKKQTELLKQGQTLYSFRHSGAIEIFKRTGSITKLQKAMGHSSINVSLTYLRGLEIAELKEEDMPMV